MCSAQSLDVAFAPRNTEREREKFISKAFYTLYEHEFVWQKRHIPFMRLWANAVMGNLVTYEYEKILVFRLISMEGVCVRCCAWLRIRICLCSFSVYTIHRHSCGIRSSESATHKPAACIVGHNLQGAAASVIICHPGFIFVQPEIDNRFTY